MDSPANIMESMPTLEELQVGIPLKAPYDPLAGHIRDIWEINQRGRQQVEQEMLSALMRFKGEYEPEKLAAIKEAGISEDFIRLSYHKSRDAASWIRDTKDPFGDRSWDIEPDTVLEIPPDVKNLIAQQIRMRFIEQAAQQAQLTGQPVDLPAIMQQIQAAEDDVEKAVMEKAHSMVEEKCTNMEQLIESQLRQGGFYEARNACIDDFTKFKAAVMRGPVPKRVKTEKWMPDPMTGRYTCQVTEEIIPSYDRVNPLDWYPSPNSISAQDGDQIELERFDRLDFQNMIGLPGYKDEAIRTILRLYPDGHRETTNVDSQKQLLEKEDTTGMVNDKTTKIECINYWGAVQGSTLRTWGMSSKDVPDEDQYYQINAKMVDTHVFHAVMNPDPLGRKPYGSSSFVKNHDSQWGESPVDLMEDLQNQANAIIRNMMTNIAIACGPVWEFDRERLASGQVAEAYPNAVIETTNKRMIEGPAIRMYQANLQVKDLLTAYQQVKREADDQVVPAYGQTQAGAAKTMGGLSILMGASGRNIKMAVDNFDNDIDIPAIQRQFTWNMLFHPDESVKGTLRVKARSARSQMAREQKVVRMNEFLALTNNPDDRQLMGIKGRAYAIGEVAKAQQLDVQQLLPALTAIEKMPPEIPSLAPPMPPTGNPPPAPKTLDAAGIPAGGADVQKGIPR